MKFPLKFVNGSLILSGVLTSASYRVGFKRIIFVVDTGSPKTFISEKDALTLQIPMNTLKFLEHMRLGGSKYELLTGKPIKLYFKTDDEKSKDFDLDITIAKTTKTSQEGIQEAMSCPSIIGTDFLIKNGLSLIFRPSKDVFYLEKEGT